MIMIVMIMEYKYYQIGEQNDDYWLDNLDIIKQ
jgi:hypothetical protein